MHARARGHGAGWTGTAPEVALETLSGDATAERLNAHTFVHGGCAEVTEAIVINYKRLGCQQSTNGAHTVGHSMVTSRRTRIYSLWNLDAPLGDTLIPFSFALVRQFGAMSARLRFGLLTVGTSGDERERLRFRRRPAGAADAGVARLDAVEEKDRWLNGVYGEEKEIAGEKGEVYCLALAE